MKRIFAAAAFIFSFGSISYAGDVLITDEKISRVYFGLILPYQTVDGLDAETVLRDENDVLLVKKLRSDIGAGVVFGALYPNDSKSFPIDHAVELSYSQSSHRAQWMNFFGDATYQVFTLDWKPHFLTDRKTQPFLGAGVYYHKLTIKNGAANISYHATRYGDAVFSGLGFNFGGGVTHYLGKHVVLKGSLKYHTGAFFMAKGMQGIYSRIKSPITVNGLLPVIEMEYIF